MAQRFGAVLTFREDVTRAEAIDALRKLKSLLDVPETVYDPKAPGAKRPFAGKDLVREFDDNYGGPVWYVP